MEQRDFRMPAAGEGWRHYKQGPSLYTIVGMAHHEATGEPLVVYTEANWSLTQLPPLYVRPLADFVGLVTIPSGNAHEKDRRVPRFEYERPAGHDPRCPYSRSPGCGLAVCPLDWSSAK